MKVRYCLSHWRDGLSWEASGAVDVNMRLIDEFGASDRMTRRTEILGRLEMLDRVFEQVAADGRLRSREELAADGIKARSFRVHIGRDGLPLWGLDGSHRIGMALALKLNDLPVEVLAVHPLVQPKALESYQEGLVVSDEQH